MMVERNRNRKQNKKEELFREGVMLGWDPKDKPANTKEPNEDSVLIREMIINYDK